MSNDILQSGIGYCKQTLKYLVDKYGLTAVQEEAARQPDFAAIVNEIMGGSAEPVPTLTPFSTRGNEILLNGSPFKFSGVNFRELIGYDNVIMPYASPSDVIIQLDGAKSSGMRVVRFYGAHVSLSVDAAIPRVKHILDELQKRDLYGIVVLTDGAQSGFQVADSPQNRGGTPNRYTERFLLEGGFRENYKPYAEAMASAIGDHDALFSIEIANELTTIDLNPSIAKCDAMLAFFTEMFTTIRERAPRRMISTGLESCWQIFVLQAYQNGQYAKRLYSLPGIVGTLHTYQINNGQILGSAYEHVQSEMALTGFPLIIEETSTLWDNESTDWLENLVKATFPRISGLMQWNLSYKYAQNIGVGDGAWNAPAGTAQARRWYNLLGYFRSLSDRLRLQY